MRLKDQVALITGGARGIGKATALTFARQGAKVAICDINEQLGNQALEELRSVNSNCLFVKMDVTNAEEVTRVVAYIVEHLGGIDILINNAGITQDAMLAKMTEQQWDRVIGVNLKGVFNCTKAVLPYMLQKQKGKVINTASVVGVYGNIGQTNYAATKAGVIGMTKSWAKELGRKGINVNAIAPGYTMTEMMNSVPEKVLELMAQKTPLGRLGEPQDIANANLFLASSESDYVNGAVLSVDGGIVI